MSTSAGYSLWLKSLTHNHSTRAGPVRIHCVMTGVFGRKWKGCASVPKHWGFFKWTYRIFANFDHWLKRITCWCVISLTWCRIMVMIVHKCCTFRLKRKNLLSPTPDACCALLTLRSIQLMTGEPRPPVQRAPVTWREWGLWYKLCHFMISVWVLQHSVVHTCKQHPNNI